MKSKKEIKKIFLSLPMKGLTHEQIEDKVKEETKKILELYPGVEVIKGWDTLQEDSSVKKHDLEYLGNGIQRMGKTDAIWLCDGWDRARGCKMEWLCALMYGLDVIPSTEPVSSKLKDAAVTFSNYK